MREQILRQLPALLVAWHRANKRPLPWRADACAYHIWLSEIMLQQTRIEAVIPYYQRFLRELPTVEALAAVPEDRLLKLWEGLGYYSRARNLKKAATVIMEQYGGELPSTVRELKALPGIGDYTAGAIASMAFGRPEPAVDGNVLRVIARLTADDADIMLPATKKRVTQELRGVYPTGKDAGDFTEGLMELGETVCIPGGQPRCDDYPAARLCRAKALGLTDRLPVRAKAKQRKIQPRTVFLLLCNGKVALRKRPDSGLLAGMWEFPNVDGRLTAAKAKEQAQQWGCDPGVLQSVGDAVHVFTHLEWHMSGYRVECRRAGEAFVWASPDALRHEMAVPAAFRAYRDCVLQQEETL